MFRILPSVKRWFWSMGLGALAMVGAQLPSTAAENIFFTYGPVKWTLRVASLEKFVKDGTVDQNLRLLVNLTGATDEELARVREFMQLRADASPVVISKFFNSSVGEDLLQRAGVLLNIPWTINGKYAIRGALVEAAFDQKEGLTLLNFLKKYPTDLHLSGEALLERAQAVDLVVRASEYFINQMKLLSAAEAEKEGPIDFKTLPDPTQYGPYGFLPKQTWWLTDKSRDRRLYVDVYRPKQWKAGKTPVVILSHGLASRPEDFDIAAQKLASYGFLVALPQHPGSDMLQAKKFLDCNTYKPYLISDFIDRPKDISFTIDELERRNATEFGDRLNLKEVGVAGHSFGGSQKCW